ncbi:MAG: hypothetical protein NW217_03675 [Hyphomicrobiaceae bacterium]|nr:hypothetical protein [Hyphomicrobiaceae bacterium]
MSLGPSIFWTTVVSIFLILGYATLVGRPVARLFSKAAQDDVRFYLSPAFGLALVLIFIAVWGRYVAFGDTPLFILLMVLLAILAAVLEKDQRGALLHAATVGAFGVAASATLLTSLWFSGALAPHNDTFTYLALGDWLQNHPFNRMVTAQDMTPASTQVALYQVHGFRMGGPYLLGLFQSVLNMKWAFDVYPALVGASTGGTALAVGLPVASALRGMTLWQRLAGLTMIGNSLGGVSFAAHYGFMPQGYGILFGAACLFAYGIQLSEIGTGKLSLRAIGGRAIPIALLLAASIFSYSELAPFVTASAGMASLVQLARTRAVSAFVSYGLVVIALGAVFLNVELVRTVQALKVQSVAVVGSPIDWHLVGYLAHAMGLHGGGWDVAQWTLGGRFGFGAAGSLLACALVLAVALAGSRRVLRSGEAVMVLPAVMMLVLCAAGVLYLRYAAHNPFPVGVGQSWSQFKLTDWSYVFVTAVVLLGALPVLARFGAAGNVMALLGAVWLCGGVLTGHNRTLSLKSYYVGETDLSSRLRSIRDAALDVCRDATSIYLDLSGQDHKFRQMLALYLWDRRLKADWTGDGYVIGWLPQGRQAEQIANGDCLIEHSSLSTEKGGTVVGQARIRQGVEDLGEVRVTRVDGINQVESDKTGWWLWVAGEARIALAPRGISPEADRAEIAFWIGSEQSQDVVVVVSSMEGGEEVHEFRLDTRGVSKVIALSMPPASIRKVTFRTSAEPKPIGSADPRKANFLLRNLTVLVKSSG